MTGVSIEPHSVDPDFITLREAGATMLLRRRFKILLQMKKQTTSSVIAVLGVKILICLCI